MSHNFQSNQILQEILADQTWRRNQQKVIDDLMEGQSENKFAQIWSSNQIQQEVINIPINSFNADNPIYINPKQYRAILTRRAKKIKQKIQQIIKDQQQNSLQSRKSVQRSQHAKQRKRDSSGKFIT